MNKEQLRMQMLSGVITESEYKVKLRKQEKESLNEHFDCRRNCWNWSNQPNPISR
jgi:hypothetical protein